MEEVLEYVPQMYATFCALIPPIVAIVLALSDSNASVGLMLGSFFALIITIIFYVIRRVISFKKACECIPEGFKAMVPAILILTFAWTLKIMTDSLGAKYYVAGLVNQMSGSLVSTLPAIIFVVAVFLAFATGTSWGTFGILIPIVVDTFQDKNPVLMIISISACMAGAVCGDHCSPISDTTIMASAGAQCNHVSNLSCSWVSFLKCFATIQSHLCHIRCWQIIILLEKYVNTDDHLRNRAFMFAENGWALSPLYDVKN